ncbi:unnamed protein product [Nesidiocoris tenuis]|uniref:Uncharacterized protein n=1 Tax=Nesidiocoris tenuis TaxID=355587 RepID=A0A6H5HV66_9HEMI|nr:unnamed protein product [Nesidiocoris tenuis]
MIKLCPTFTFQNMEVLCVTYAPLFPSAECNSRFASFAEPKGIGGTRGQNQFLILVLEDAFRRSKIWLLKYPYLSRIIFLAVISGRLILSINRPLMTESNSSFPFKLNIGTLDQSQK